MPAISEAQRRRQIAERCWYVYDLITRTFTPPGQFHLDFPEQAEMAVLARALQIRVSINAGHILDLSEEYGFDNHQLIVSLYSYVLLDRQEGPKLRADPLPHHRVDYRQRKLTHFPHHLHDERGRIRSFSGRLEDFLGIAAQHIKR